MPRAMRRYVPDCLACGKALNGPELARARRLGDYRHRACKEGASLA